MLFNALIFSSAFGFAVWEMEEPYEFEFELSNHFSKEQLDKAMQATDLGGVADAKHYHAEASDECWHWNKPDHCPKKGFIKYEKVNLIKGKIGKAQIATGPNNFASLVIANVSMQIPPTKMTVQPEGIATFPCDGTVKGIIHGAAAAVQAVVDMSAEGIPILGEAAASPIDGAIVQLEHTLDGICGVLEGILSALIGMIGNVLNDLIGKILPDLVTGILGAVVQKAGDMAPKALGA